jgi:ribosomal protein S18 acetylase RimI-like enzyme
MLGFMIHWGIWGSRISMRLYRRVLRPPSAARCDVHFIDLAQALLPVIDTRTPITWETVHDLASVEDRVRDLPVEHWSDVGDRLARHHWCVVGIYDGVVAHAAWVGIGTFKAHWFDRVFRLPPSDAYLYGAYTQSSFRGLHIHPASAVERLRQVRERGIRRVYWFVDPSNHAARQLPIRLGAVRVGTAGYVEVAGIRVHYLTDIGHLTRSNPRLLVEKR